MAYKRFKGETLPDNAMYIINGDEYATGWCEAYYQGDVNTTDDWIIVMDSGGSYKVWAIYMTWYKSCKGNIVGKCNWSKSALHRTIMALKKGDEPPYDPGYQT